MITALVLALAAAAPLDDGSLVADFRRFYDADRSTQERREMVLSLEGVDSLAAVQALSVAFEDEEFLVQRAAIDTVGACRNRAAAQWLVDGILLERKMSRRTLMLSGAAEAVGAMGHGFAYEPLTTLLPHKELAVRLAAIAGLGRLGDARAVESLSALLEDRANAVVIAALEAIAKIGDESGTDAVLAGLAHADKHVRIKAVDVMGRMRLKAGVRPLIMMIDGDPDPRVSEDAFNVLQAITLRQFPDETAPWLSWWDRTEERFVMPDLEKIAEAKERIAREGGRYTSGKSFESIQTKSDHIIFVIDVSQSMGEPFGDPERLQRTGREYKSLERLEIVKEELINTINALPDSTSFNIIAFASDVDIWKKKSVRANVLNRRNAEKWVGKLSPLGGDSAAFRARMGLNSPGANEGLTNTHLALMAAFGEEVDEDRRGGQGFVTEVTDDIDTIFFLTDGEPTVGKTVDLLEIREEVKRVNAFRGVQIHVIYVGALGGKSFRDLAEENGGVFVSIGG